MPFPYSPRVVYQKNPLEEVICQLRFPTILKIGSEPPSAFQDRIRGAYPLFKDKAPVEIAGIPPEIAQMVAKGLPFHGGHAGYDFTSADQVWTISLTPDFLALTCRKYERWEDFLQHLKGPLDALLALYSPAFLSRIGLRYRDVIRRSQLGLDGISWGELLRPPMAGVLACQDIADTVQHTAQEIVIRLEDDQSQVRVRHGLAEDAGSGEQCYLIDCDFFLDQTTETADAHSKLDFLNRQGRLFFRWCITDRLHDAMGPQPIPDR
jgi:uncharacterized protein (TIGR04255 family)